MAAPAQKKKKSARKPSALKRQRQNLRRRERNLLRKQLAKQAIRALRKETDITKLPELLAQVYSRLDKLAKNRVFHKNKVGRLKAKWAAYVNQKLALQS